MTQKRVSRTSSNGPPRNYRGTLEVNLKTCAKGTKLRVYRHVLNLKSNVIDNSHANVPMELVFNLKGHEKKVISTNCHSLSSYVMELVGVV